MLNNRIKNWYYLTLNGKSCLNCLTPFSEETTTLVYFNTFYLTGSKRPHKLNNSTFLKQVSENRSVLVTKSTDSELKPALSVMLTCHCGFYYDLLIPNKE